MRRRRQRQLPTRRSRTTGRRTRRTSPSTDTLPAGVTFVSVDAVQRRLDVHEQRRTSRSPAPGPTWTPASTHDLHHRGHRPGPSDHADQQRRSVAHRPPPTRPGEQHRDSVDTTSTRLADLAIVKTGPATVRGGRQRSATTSTSRTTDRRTPPTSRSPTPCRPASRSFPSTRQRWLGLQQQRQRLGHLHPRHLATGSSTDVHHRRHRARPADDTDQHARTSPRRPPDPDPTNNNDSVNTTVTASADLSRRPRPARRP